MNWIGAVIGALLCLRGGWWSMLVGALVGHYVEERLRESRKRGKSASESDRRSPPSALNDDPYGVLGCVRSDDDATLRKAYHDLAKRLHPDVLRAQGVTGARLDEAAKAMARVNAAWRAIEKARGLRT